MTVKDLQEKLNLKILVGDENSLQNEIDGCYCGDLLSWVMSRAQENDVWLTVMGNRNTIAVASLAGVACIVLCEESELDDDAKERAEQQGVAVLSATDNIYRTAVNISLLIG